MTTQKHQVTSMTIWAMDKIGEVGESVVRDKEDGLQNMHTLWS